MEKRFFAHGCAPNAGGYSDTESLFFWKKVSRRFLRRYWASYLKVLWKLLYLSTLATIAKWKRWLLSEKSFRIWRI